MKKQLSIAIFLALLSVAEPVHSYHGDGGAIAGGLIGGAVLASAISAGARNRDNSDAYEQGRQDAEIERLKAENREYRRKLGRRYE